MKRYLSLIFIIALTVIIAGCGGSSSADKYGVGKEIKIAEEVTSDEILALVEETEENIEEIKKVSINLVVKGEMIEDGKTQKQTGEAKIVFDFTDPENAKAQISYEAKLGEEKQTMNLYVVDGNTYMHTVSEEGEAKYKYPPEYDMGVGYISSLILPLEEFLSYADDLFEEASYGKDKDGNVIFQSSEKLDDEYNNEYRFVIKDGLVQYAYMETGEEDYCQKYTYSLNYEEVKFDFPKNFDGYLDLTTEEE